MGARDPETGKDRNRERERQRRGDRGLGRETRGPRALGKGAGSKGGLQHKRHGMVRARRQMWGQREAGRAKQGIPTQINVGVGSRGLKENKESQ